MHIGPEAKYFISVTWELTPPHRGAFCNYILSCQTLLLVIYHAPYVSHRDIIVVLISGPKPSGPEPMEIWEKRLVNNVSTICYWTTVREYLLNCRFIRGHWPLTLNSCNELCPWFFAFGHTNYARWLPVFHPRSIQQSMMLSWRVCVLWNGVIRSATVIVIDMVAVAHIIKPQRASIFGEYTHMQLMHCLQSYMTENMSYFGSSVKSFSGTQLISITSSSQQMLTLYSALSQLVWQPCLYASKKKLTHGWCSIFIMLLDKVTLRPLSWLYR